MSLLIRTWIFVFLAMLPGAASAVDPGVQTLQWDVFLNGQRVGKRVLTIRYVPLPEGTLKRIVESSLDIQPPGSKVPTWQQRVAGHAGLLPASFHSVIMEKGGAREVQARVAEDGWVVSLVEGGKSKTFELAGNRIDMSTVDFLDPSSAVPMSRYDDVRVLSAESGEILEGKVLRMGPSDLMIGGTLVHTEEYMLEAGGARSSLFYTADGFLVRWDTRIGLLDVVNMLAEPPPAGIDDAPVPIGGSEIIEVQL